MRKNYGLLLLLISILTNTVTAQNTILDTKYPLQKPLSGKMVRLYLPSQYVDIRPTDIWLPEGYPDGGSYDVLYMHDGQMLFDSVNNWNKQEWNVDETVGKLIRKNKIKNCIVVGIWNIPEKRFADYFPQKVVDNILEPAKSFILEKQFNGQPNADNYLKFLVTELKPFIDNNYSTNTDRESTFIMGSSMGGLISMYAICEYPEAFGGAACLSIHSPLIMPSVIDENTDKFVASKFRDYLLSHLPKVNTRKIYMDYGDQTLDAYYAPYQKKIDEVMVNKGWKFPHWETRFYPGTNHSEQAWSDRLSIPLEFLMGTK